MNSTKGGSMGVPHLLGRFFVLSRYYYSRFFFNSQPTIVGLLSIMSIEVQHTRIKPLKELIREAGYTQKSFAQAIGRAYSTVQFYVSGEKMPSAEVLAEMSRVLKKSPKVILSSLGIDTQGIPDDTPNS